MIESIINKHELTDGKNRCERKKDAKTKKANKTHSFIVMAYWINVGSRGREVITADLKTHTSSIKVGLPYMVKVCSDDNSKLFSFMETIIMKIASQHIMSRNLYSLDKSKNSKCAIVSPLEDSADKIVIVLLLAVNC